MEQHPGKQGRRHRLDQQSNRRLRGRDTTQGVRDGCLPKTCEITANPMSQIQSTATGGSSLSPPSGTKVTNARLLRTELASASAEALIRSRAAATATK